MDVKDVNFKRFIADEGMVLKWREKSWNYLTNEVRENTRWTPYSAVIDINSIIGEIEEITYDQYKKETRCCGLGS